MSKQRVASAMVLAIFAGSAAALTATAAEREQVRAMVNLLASVKMPYPERYERNVARTEFVLREHGSTSACLRLDDKLRWCFEHIHPAGSQAEILRIRNEPVAGIEVGQQFHYVADYDLDGLIDVGSTTRLDPPPHAPVANVIQFFHRSTKRGDDKAGEYQKLYDDGIQIALKYLGE